MRSHCNLFSGRAELLSRLVSLFRLPSTPLPTRSESIRWDVDIPAATVEHVSGEHRRADIPMSQQRVDRPNIIAFF